MPFNTRGDQRTTTVKLFLPFRLHMGSGGQIQVVRLEPLFLPAESSHQPISYLLRTEMGGWFMGDNFPLLIQLTSGRCWHSGFKGNKTESLWLFLYIVYLARGEWLRVKELQLDQKYVFQCYCK